MRILHETMSMPMVMKRIAGKIGSIGRSTVAVENDYKTLKQAIPNFLLVLSVVAKTVLLVPTSVTDLLHIPSSLPGKPAP